MQHFSKLKVWEKGHALVLEVCRLTKSFPSDERFGLVSQLRRATLSVPTNISEGVKRRTGQNYARFLNMAEGSLSESEYLVTLSRGLGYLRPELAKGLLTQIGEIARMLHGLRRRVVEADR